MRTSDPISSTTSLNTPPQKESSHVNISDNYHTIDDVMQVLSQYGGKTILMYDRKI